jgi:DNA-directed RNA polymerase subunit beta
MAERNSVRRRVRKTFGRTNRFVDIPSLIDMQKHSYDRFLQRDIPPEKREDDGLQGVFKSIFPIHDFANTSSLEFVKYKFEEVKYNEEDYLSKGMTWDVPLRLTVRLVVFDIDVENGTKSIRDIKEQEIYFGTIPLMTERATFIVNGTERVVVSQLHRSPGVFFDHDKGKKHSSGKVLYFARIIPLRGSWLDFEFDPKDILHVRIDRRRKFPVTIFLKALGYSTREILNYFYETEVIRIDKDVCWREARIENLYRKRLTRDVFNAETGEILAKKGDKYTKRLDKTLKSYAITHIPIDFDDIRDRVITDDLVDPETGEILLQGNQPITDETFELIKEKEISEIECLVLDAEGVSSTIRDTMLVDKISSSDEAILEIYRKMRPSRPPTQEIAYTFFNNLFFNIETYDLSKVGRVKLNYRLNLEVPLEQRVLRREDILSTVNELIHLKNTEALVDDIDNLGNRRVRAVGELLENQYRVGMIRMERAIKERMSLQEIETLMPYDLINSKPVTAVVNEFFGTSQLSQFMDQTNPLSEITHKRRLSALGPGGLTRERAGFEVRDVHPTHYGRICPIETPEGPNIGLIVSLSTYARVNALGFIETPYRHVKDCVALKEIEYLSALDEKEYPIAQANAPLDDNGRFINDEVSARIAGEAARIPAQDIKYMDISPDQLVSVSAALIPFLEHDDANRALMGSNMMRQAVPLLNRKAPLVGTGIESVIMRDSGTSIIAKRDGIVEDVDASRIVIRSTDILDDGGPDVEIYRLSKFERSNQNSCYTQKPIIRKGETVAKGQTIADGPASEFGELALGQNMMVAFMSWGGYNFEDSILISERVVKDDCYTSIHIEEFELLARDTKLGKEEITRDIPNVGEDALRNLDDSGIVKVGAEIKPGDVLIGKITPKGETQLSPEEKLLRAIFGDKAGDVKDSSYRVAPGVQGVVIDVKVFTRRGVEKDERTLAIKAEEVERFRKDLSDEVGIMTRSTRERLKGLLVGKLLKTDLRERGSNQMLLRAGEPITAENIDQIQIEVWSRADLQVSMDDIDKVESVIDSHISKVKYVSDLVEEKIDKSNLGDELAPGVIKMVKVYVAVKRKLSVGDKMAGRHGNKGVLSRILPVEDMPYFADGTPVDVVLNPLGVPSRMNVGQVLETHMGWASYELGRQIGNMVDHIKDKKDIEKLKKKLKSLLRPEEYSDIFEDILDEQVVDRADLLRDGLPMATPVFDGAEEDAIRKSLKDAGLPITGQTTLYDGRTGEAFDQDVTVGIMYVLKLHHLVDDKLHARSIGPYSLVTQQPLGGKAQFGGQRLGEMEVWAMESYGAAYSLQEFLTVKSDDVLGRTRMYERIVKGKNTLEPGLPESFKVLLKELKSLGLEVELYENSQVE